MINRNHLFVCALGLLVFTTSASAQSVSNWGFHSSVGPRWSIPSTVAVIFGDDVQVEGNELRIGVARGRMLSGDWSVNYVRKRIADGSSIAFDDVFRAADHVVVDGVSVDKFIPFGTIKRRVQIGLLLGGGVGWAKGEVTERNEDGLRVQTDATHFLAPFDMATSVVPLARMELGVSVITLPGLKVRATAGFNYPGITRLTIGSVYLFGER